MHLPTALNAHDLPSVSALVHYLHAAAGFPVKSTWLAAIKAGNFASWPGLTYTNASNFCPSSDETIKGHLSQVRQGLRSTKPKPRPTLSLPPTPASPSKELHIWSDPISKLFTDNMGCFPVRFRSGNQYIMLAYHCDSNAILVKPFQSRNDRHHIPAYSRLMTRLQARGHTVNHQVLDNEASAEFIRTITQDWKATYQLVPPDIHRRNLAERAIQTFKAHFLSILAGQVFPQLPLGQTSPANRTHPQSTPTIMHRTLSISVEYFNNTPFNFDATPLGPCGCPVLIHNKPSKHSSWAFCGRDGFNIGPALSHYRCFQVVDADTKAIVISDTVEFRHTYLSPPSVSYKDRLLHAITFLSTAINEATNDSINSQLIAIDQLHKIFSKWKLASAPLALLPPSPPTPEASPQSPRTLVPAAPPTPPTPAPRVVPVTAPRVHNPMPLPPMRDTTSSPPLPPPIAASLPPPLVIPDAPGLGEAIALRTRSRTLAATRAANARANTVMFANIAQATRSTATTNALIAAAVLDHATGQSLEYRQLIKHPKDLELLLRQRTWPSMPRLPKFQTHVPPVDGTDTFHVIDFANIPPDRLNKVCYSNVVCKVRPEKTDPDRTRITIAGNRICYPGDVGTKTAPLELVKLMINSVLSRQGFCTFDVANFYLCTPLDRSEYIKNKLSDIPQEFITEYNLLQHVHNGWVYFEIRKGIYGLPQ
eukprot:CCRYP_018758-RA/>CCRYP_018758-RA protein AED:0.17 eAED:0.24 QI:0/0/0/1/0.5/0.33/3/0/705